MSNHESPEHGQDGQHAQVTFERPMGLFDATMIGLGVMLGAGIFVLIGVASGVAGPAAVLVFAINAVLTLFTCLSYMELSSAIPEAGGGYSYIRRAFPLWVSFISGWALWFALTVSCALFALGFGSYFWEMLHLYWPTQIEAIEHAFAFWPHGHVILMTLFIGACFILLNYKGAEVTGKAENVLTVGKIFTLLVFVGFGGWNAIKHPYLIEQGLLPFMPNGAGSVIAALGLTFIAFGGYDLICSVAEEVRDPKKNIPKAIWLSYIISSIGRVIIVFIALGAIPVIDGLQSWQLLGKHGETGLITASAEFMPAFWVGVVAFGGLLATTGALNASVLAASRVAFTMGRDGMLPKALAQIHHKNRTPFVAILVTGAILALLSVTLDVQTVGSASSVMFLMTFSLVNMSALALRRDRSIKPLYRMPLFPWPPILGVITSVFLIVYQLNLGKSGITSLIVSTAWVLIGLAVYFAFFRREAEKHVPQTIRPFAEVVPEIKPVRYRIMVQVYNPDSVELLVRIGCKVAKETSGDVEVVVAYIVEVPVQVDVKEGLKYVPQAEKILHPAHAVAEAEGVDLRTEIRVAHKVTSAITEMARTERVNLLVIGWKGWTSRRESFLGSVVDEVAETAPCDVMVVRTTPSFEPDFKRILLPTSGGPSARFAARLAPKLLAEDGVLTLFGCAVGGMDHDSREKARNAVQRTLAELPTNINVHREMHAGRTVPAAVLKEADTSQYDLIMMGATRTTWFKRALFGEIPEQVAHHSDSPVILVKYHEGAKTWLNKFLGA